MKDKSKQRITVAEAQEIIREEISNNCDENDLEEILKEMGFGNQIKK